MTFRQRKPIASPAYRKLAADFKLNISMNRRANPWDSAPMESFFKTLKVEKIYQLRYETHALARLDMVDWIEGYYNRENVAPVDRRPFPE